MKQRYNCDRLKDALKFRDYSLWELSEGTGIDINFLTLYLNKDSCPPLENILKIANHLKFPYEYFFQEDILKVKTLISFSQENNLKLVPSLEIKLEYLLKLYLALSERVSFPTQDYLAFNYPLDTEIESDDNYDKIAEIADNLREGWGLGSSVVTHLKDILEDKGILITKLSNISKCFSSFLSADNHNYFIIAVNKYLNRASLDFNLVHELGHLILHTKDTARPGDKERILKQERQAAFFAVAFFYPQACIKKEFKANTSIEEIKELSCKWNLAPLAILYWARTLEIISHTQFLNLKKNLKEEPRKTKDREVFGTNIFQHALELFDDISLDDILNIFRESNLSLNVDDIEDLTSACLDQWENKSQIVSLKNCKK